MQIVIVTEGKKVLMKFYVTTLHVCLRISFEFLIVNDGLVGGRPLCRLILYTIRFVVHIISMMELFLSTHRGFWYFFWHNDDDTHLIMKKVVNHCLRTRLAL